MPVLPVAVVDHQVPIIRLVVTNRRVVKLLMEILYGHPELAIDFLDHLFA